MIESESISLSHFINIYAKEITRYSQDKKDANKNIGTTFYPIETKRGIKFLLKTSLTIIARINLRSKKNIVNQNRGMLRIFLLRTPFMKNVSNLLEILSWKRWYN